MKSVGFQISMLRNQRITQIVITTIVNSSTPQKIITWNLSNHQSSQIFILQKPDLTIRSLQLSLQKVVHPLYKNQFLLHKLGKASTPRKDSVIHKLGISRKRCMLDHLYWREILQISTKLVQS